MLKKCQTFIIESLKKKKHPKEWKIIMWSLMILTTFLTTYFLILPAITVEETKTDDVGKIAIVHDGQIIIKKVDANNVDQLLNGAEFVLKNDKGQFLNFKNPEDIEWVSNQSEASIYTTNQGGTVTIKGLAEGTYSLLETKAPAGYNLMTDETPVELKLGAEGNQDTLLVTSTVKNNKGTELPSTGGIGTTIFYIIGAILVIGAGIVLVARRRLRS